MAWHLKKLLWAIQGWKLGTGFLISSIPFFSWVAWVTSSRSQIPQCICSSWACGRPGDSPCSWYKVWLGRHGFQPSQYWKSGRFGWRVCNGSACWVTREGWMAWSRAGFGKLIKILNGTSSQIFLRVWKFPLGWPLWSYTFAFLSALYACQKLCVSVLLARYS